MTEEKHSFDTIEETLNPKKGGTVTATMNQETWDAFNKFFDTMPAGTFLHAKFNTEEKHQPLPVSVYKPQDVETVKLVNAHKEVEEQILRALDVYKDNPEVDQRWLAIGRTHLEQAFMAINRSIFKPDRVKLPEDK